MQHKVAVAVGYEVGHVSHFESNVKRMIQQLLQLLLDITLIASLLGCEPISQRPTKPTLIHSTKTCMKSDVRSVAVM